jgi:hypothetical protein
LRVSFCWLIRCRCILLTKTRGVLSCYPLFSVYCQLPPPFKCNCVGCARSRRWF